jgi:hypothetical protein
MFVGAAVISSFVFIVSSALISFLCVSLFEIFDEKRERAIEVTDR